MKTENIPYGQISEIARDVTKGYNPKALPSLEEVAWSFPVEGQGRTHYHKFGYIDRIPNTQEGNAMRQLMTFKNFNNVLQYLSEGKTASRGLIPHHIFPCGDADDGAYMIYPYTKQEELIREGKTQNGFFWETLPKELMKFVLKVENTGRGKVVDNEGKEIERLGKSAFVDEGLTRQYLENLRRAYELGSEHLSSVAKSDTDRDGYDQLIVDANTKNWKEGGEFQRGFYSEGEPGLHPGKVLANLGDKLKVEIWDFHRPSNKLVRNYKSDQLKIFGEKGLLWRLKSKK